MLTKGLDHESCEILADEILALICMDSDQDENEPEDVKIVEDVRMADMLSFDTKSINGYKYFTSLP